MTRPTPAEPSERVSLLPALVWFALGLLCIAGFFETGRYYHDFLVAQVGVQWIDPSELVFYAWYGLWGSAATGCIALAIDKVRVGTKLLDFARAIALRPMASVAVASLVVFALAALLRSGVFLGQPVADDESAYLFEAQTLARGRVVNEVPPSPEFWQQQFIAVNAHGWFGQYPLGHPALLALGELVGLRGVIVPLCGLCAVWLTFLLGRELLGEKRAALGAVLLALSPQFVFTHATLLSQTTSSALMLAGAWLLLRAERHARARDTALGFACFGFACIVRPLPGALFAAAALCAHGYETLREPATRSRALILKRLIAAVLPLAACGALLLYVNALQSGDALRSGYSEVHAHVISTRPKGADVAISVAGALLRQNFWLFGWTLSLLFVPFCRPRRGAPLFFGLIAAEYAYRVLNAKTVVASTGPIYVFEIVPLLALASADGAVRVADRLAQLGVRDVRARLSAFLAAGSTVALFAFVPVALSPIATSSALRLRVYALLAERHASRALVFANFLVSPDRSLTWANFPPNPAPTFDDAVIFPRFFEGAGAARASFALWREHFRDRRAFVFYDQRDRYDFAELDPEKPPAASVALRELAGAESAPAAP